MGLLEVCSQKLRQEKTIPAVATLVKIADALGVKVSVLIEENAQNGTIFIPKDATKDVNHVIKTDKGYSFFAFAVDRREKLMQPYLFVAKKGEIRQHLFSHVGEEFIFMLEGDMNYKVGQVEYTLHPGDSVYFNSLEEHMLTPLSDEVQYLAIFTESKK